jgi:hypothetical protein
MRKIGCQGGDPGIAALDIATLSSSSECGNYRSERRINLSPESADGGNDYGSDKCDHHPVLHSGSAFFVAGKLLDELNDFHDELLETKKSTDALRRLPTIRKGRTHTLLACCCNAGQRFAFFLSLCDGQNLVAMFVKILNNNPPRLLTPAAITVAIVATSRAYSTAVAPTSSVSHLVK